MNIEQARQIIPCVACRRTGVVSVFGSIWKFVDCLFCNGAKELTRFEENYIMNTAELIRRGGF